FKGIRSPDANVAEHAVHFWSNAGGTLVERNKIVNCDRGIGFGLGTDRGHNGGIIRNNMIFHDDLGSDRGDVSIEMETAVGTEVYNNTIYQKHSYQAAISARFGGSSVYIANNLVKITGGGTRAIWNRNGATITREGNILSAQAAWFAGLADGDLHLASSVPEVVDQGVAVGGLTEDFDGDGRPQGGAPDVGADEYRAGTGGGGGGSGGGSAVESATWARVKGAYR
ncbi:MAG: hypothetical protein HKN12_10215, partial [Gemmatimonadetes bacterium]|nr:hypothetical protein [Gemmatimonadota bacterium]